MPEVIRASEDHSVQLCYIKLGVRWKCPQITTIKVFRIYNFASWRIQPDILFEKDLNIPETVQIVIPQASSLTHSLVCWRKEWFGLGRACKNDIQGVSKFVLVSKLIQANWQDKSLPLNLPQSLICTLAPKRHTKRQMNNNLCKGKTVKQVSRSHFSFVERWLSSFSVAPYRCSLVRV